MTNITAKIILIASIFMVFTGSYSCAEETQKEEIVIIFGHRFPPYYSINSSKESAESLKGYFIDILENFKKSHPQYDIAYKCLPRGRINKTLTAGKADAFALTDPMFMSNEISMKYTYSTPLWEVEDHLLVRKDSDIINADLENLKGKHIAVLHGNGYGPLDQYFENGKIYKHAVYRTSQIIELVQRNRVDGAVCNEMTFPKLMKRTKHSFDSFRLIEKPLYKYNLHLLVKKEKINFLADFNSFLKNADYPSTDEIIAGNI